eukprot:GHVS01021627.1.p1 GENE.GHVS01021627.1~~GHVS01021627.1.p1  ORF type:complete len:343 (-),score=19.08 GHVS01021627.1:321-1349(-)
MFYLVMRRATFQCRPFGHIAGGSGGAAAAGSTKRPKNAGREGLEDPTAVIHLFDAFNFMTYNIMHKLNNSQNMKNLSRYYYCSPANLHFRNRFEKLTERVRELAPDILCLQEIDPTSLNNITSETSLAEGTSLFHSSEGGSDGCAVLYRSDKFELLHSYSFRFGYLISKYFPLLKLSNLIHSEKAVARDLRDRPNLAVVATLKIRNTSKIIHAASTHLYWDPLFADIKLLQSYILTKEIHEYVSLFHKKKGAIPSKEAGNEPIVILGGDFNSLPPTEFSDGRKDNRESDTSSGVYELATFFEADGVFACICVVMISSQPVDQWMCLEVASTSPGGIQESRKS